jgi:hypothetical protein
MEKIMTLKNTSIARLVGAAAALLALGCGSSGSGTGNTNPAAMFTGAWTFGSGAITPSCGTITVPPFDLAGDTMNITRVSDTEVATSLTGTGVMCNVNFDVSGTTATAQPNQTCLVTAMIAIAGTPTTVPVTINIQTWTLVVSGNMLSINMSGTATAESIINCTPTATGTATRSGDGGA